MAVLTQLPAKPLVVGFPKQVFALDPHSQRGVLKQSEAERLLSALCLEQSGMGSAIREQQAVAAELAIVLQVAEVTAIAPVVAAISGVFVEPLIDPIPDKPALQAWMIAKRLPIVAVAPVLLPMAWAYSQRISGRCSPGRPIHLASAHLGTAGKG